MKYTCIDDALGVIAPRLNEFISNEKYVNKVLRTMRATMLCPEEERAEMAVYIMGTAYTKFVEVNGIKALKLPLKEMYRLLYDQHDMVHCQTVLNDIDSDRLVSYTTSYRDDDRNKDIFIISGTTLIWNGEKILELVSDRINGKIDVFTLEFLENWVKTLSIFGMNGYDKDVFRKALLNSYRDVIERSI